MPKKHHINCGFSVVSHNITLNLLAEVCSMCECACCVRTYVHTIYAHVCVCDVTHISVCFCELSSNIL